MSTSNQPPPIPKNPPASSQARRRGMPWGIVLLVVAVVLGGAGYFGYHIYQLYDYPPGYRNRPSIGLHRPGEHEFDAADNQIDSYNGTNAFGNSPAAVELAHDFSDVLKEGRTRLFTPGFKFELLDNTKSEFMTYCELHQNECAFIVHVPGLRSFNRDIAEKVDARKLLAQLAWASAQSVLKSHDVGKPKMELAVGLRGISQYGPIMIGYYEKDFTNPEEGLLKYLDSGAQTHFIWPFFAPEKTSVSEPK